MERFVMAAVGGIGSSDFQTQSLGQSSPQDTSSTGGLDFGSMLLSALGSNSISGSSQASGDSSSYSSIFQAPKKDSDSDIASILMSLMSNQSQFGALSSSQSSGGYDGSGTSASASSGGGFSVSA
jgi:hypothetical protein